MNYNIRKMELLNKQKRVMQKHKELLGEACELVVGLQELLEDFSDTVDCINYVTQDEGVAKEFRLAAALLYVETPNDFETVKNLKNNMKLQKNQG